MSKPKTPTTLREWRQHLRKLRKKADEPMAVGKLAKILDEIRFCERVVQEWGEDDDEADDEQAAQRSAGDSDSLRYCYDCSTEPKRTPAEWKRLLHSLESQAAKASDPVRLDRLKERIRYVRHMTQLAVDGDDVDTDDGDNDEPSPQRHGGEILHVRGGGKIH